MFFECKLLSTRAASELVFLQASNQLEEKSEENERLQAENQELQQTLAKITMYGLSVGHPPLAVG